MIKLIDGEFPVRRQNELHLVGRSVVRRLPALRDAN